MKKLEKKKNLKNSSGRSMVEMLGVLAIIGVLSIGGIAGFKQAMNRIKINAIKSWLNELEFAMLENCYYKGNNECMGTDSLAYIRRHKILCNAMGDAYCSDVSSVYVPLKYTPNIEWAVSASSNQWTVGFRHLTEAQCELIFRVDLPKNVVSVVSNNYTAVLTPTWSEANRKYGLSRCKYGAKNDANWGGIYSLHFATP